LNPSVARRQGDFSFSFVAMMKQTSQKLLMLGFSALILGLIGCNPTMEKTSSEDFKRSIKGQAQGTTWSIVYYDLQERDFKPQIDSILAAIDQSVSTYLKGSTIDQWNASDSGAVIDDLFLELLIQSWEVYQQTNGAFDPTVKPLVSYWGFGPERYMRPEETDSAVIDSLLALVDFDTLRLRRSEQRSMKLDELKEGATGKGEWFLEKPIPGMQLDFNAIGQGWSVDKIGQLLSDQDIEIFFVELGGEILAGYPKPDGILWRFGIDKPVEGNTQRDLQAIINLRNKGLATSGSYRKFYERDGVRYSHTIDPSTGYPVQHSLLSATVVASDAGYSDALATAFMVMGSDSAQRFIADKDYLGAYVYLISANETGSFETFTSESLKGMMEAVVE
jgi:FAD:protein FMN transferase